ncbi:MAG: hypothetical protein ACRDRP_07355 [Pseudonocardiaceae bacterium]
MTTRHDECELPHDEIITGTRYTHDFGAADVGGCRIRTELGAVLSSEVEAALRTVPPHLRELDEQRTTFVTRSARQS